MSSIDWTQFSVLIVEDEPDLRDILSIIFKKKGCHVETAANGQEGFNIVQARTIDIVISDVRMPVEDGIQMLKRIRERHPKLPIVFLATGFADIDPDSAQQMGAAGLLHKPFSSSALIKTIEAVLLESLALGKTA